MSLDQVFNFPVEATEEWDTNAVYTEVCKNSVHIETKPLLHYVDMNKQTAILAAISILGTYYPDALNMKNKELIAQIKSTPELTGLFARFNTLSIEES
jgi:hypothetical protein